MLATQPDAFFNQRVAEHKNSAIGKYFLAAHGGSDLLNESHFKVLRKCQSVWNALYKEIQS